MAKKIILIVLGLIALIVGLAIAAVGGIGLGFGGRSGVIETGYHTVSTPTTAFVTDPAEIRNSNNAGRTGSAQILVGGRNSSKPLFIGIATKEDVLRYLNGAPYEQVSDIDVSNNFRLTTKLIPGTTQPAAPGDQPIWLAQASGQAPQMQWSITSGDYQVVVMNADASPGVALDARAGLKIKGLFGIALGATIFGGLLALLGVGLMIWGIAAKRTREQALAGGYPPSSYPPTYPPASYPPTSTPPGAPPPGSVPPPPPGSVPPPPPGGMPRPPGSAPPPPGGMPPPP